MLQPLPYAETKTDNTKRLEKKTNTTSNSEIGYALKVDSKITDKVQKSFQISIRPCVEKKQNYQTL